MPLCRIRATDPFQRPCTRPSGPGLCIEACANAIYGRIPRIRLSLRARCWLDSNLLFPPVKQNTTKHGMTPSEVIASHSRHRSFSATLYKTFWLGLCVEVCASAIYGRIRRESSWFADSALAFASAARRAASAMPLVSSEASWVLVPLQYNRRLGG